jgi:hypothetical protein
MRAVNDNSKYYWSSWMHDASAAATATYVCLSPVQVDYDMPQKALTNHIIAPAHLLEKYRKQKHLMLTAGQVPQLLPASYQQQQGEAQDGQAAAAGAGQVEDATVAALAAVAAAISEQQQHAAGSLAASNSRPNKRKAAAAAAEEPAAAAEAGAAVDYQDGAAYGAAGDGSADQPEAAIAEDDMDLDAMLDAAIDKHTAAAAAASAGAAAAAATDQDLEQDSIQPAAAECATPAAAAAGAAAASGAAARPNPGRRLGGFSMQHTGLGISYLGSAARPIVRSTPMVPPPSGQKLLPAPAAAEGSSSAANPFLFGSQALVPLLGGADHAAVAAAMPWLVVGGQGSISRLQQRRLQIVMARLLEHGFVIKQVGDGRARAAEHVLLSMPTWMQHRHS